MAATEAGSVGGSAGGVMTMTSQAELLGQGHGGAGSWERLPQHILVTVMTFLTPHQRLQMALTCRNWSGCLQHPLLWRRFLCQFKTPEQEKVLGAVELHGQRIRALLLELDQGILENRKNACKALSSLADNKERKLTSLTIHFLGQNPIFYQGLEFTERLKLLFGCPPTAEGEVREEGREEGVSPATATTAAATVPYSLLTHVDLSGLDIALNDSLFTILADNHPALEFLNIQNKSLVCSVTPQCVLHLVSRCLKLRDLRLFHISVTDEILTTIAEQTAPCLQHLSIVHRRDTKYTEDLSSDAWSRLVRTLPSLRVTLGFDHTCPLNRISEVLKPEIPVTELRLETFTRIYDEVDLTSAYYHNTLERLVLNTRNSEELGSALVRVAQTCKRLRSLLVYCVLSQSVIDTVLEELPALRRTGDFILKSTLEEGPWVVGAETDQEAQEMLSQQPST